MSDQRRVTYLGSTISRRTFVGSASVVGLALAGCTPERPAPRSEQGVDALARQPLPPEGPVVEGYFWLTDEEARTVEAVVARLIPGDADDPGAIEAGVPTYIDRKLERHDAFPDPAFLQPPFAVGYAEGEDPPQADSDWVPVPEAELEHYGHQSPHTPRHIYRVGLAALDQFAQERHGGDFADLEEEQQDQVLSVLDDARDPEEEDEGHESGPGAGEGAEGEGEDTDEGDATSTEDDLGLAEEIFGDLDPGLFFDTIYGDTIEGMFADPMYGGNRGLVGWLLLGYPGAQRSYSPREMLHGTDKQPQAMHGLPVMSPDRSGGGRPAIEQHDHLGRG